MALTSLNIANLPVPARPAAPSAPAAPAEPNMLEMGTTGTGIFGQGYIRELGEYNELFSGGPFSAYRTFEKMRRGDAQVAATVMAMKLPVRCAEWTVAPPNDATPAEKECAEFVEANLFDDTDFDRTLENQLLALDFGAACHEDIWTITNGKVCLKKLAPRMPLTFYTWTVDGNEDLVALIQHGFHGGSFSEFCLPANKICLYSFRQEGSNFAGRAILREMYQHWFTKAALYKIDAIACERNGMGVPTGTLGQNAGKEDRVMFEKFLGSLAAHQSSYVMMPNGYNFELKGVVGQVRDCTQSIQHHNMQISMAGLAQFMIMGQASRGGGGNRSLGETMSDFFYLSLQALANQVGDAYSDSTIARLAAYNYDPLKVRAPRLVPQQIIAMKFESITDALSKLGTAGVLTWDPDLELWVRQKMGAPKQDKAEIVRLRQQKISTGSQGGQQQPGSNEGTPDGHPGQESGQGKDGPENAKSGGKGGKVAASEITPDEEGGAGAGNVNGDAPPVKTRREPGSIGSDQARRAEKCLALSAITGELDKGRDDIAAAMRAARPAIQSEIIHKVLNRPMGQMHRASVEADPKLVAAVLAILHRVHDFGQRQVGEERAKQRDGAAPSTAAKIRAAAAKANDPLGLYADGVVGEFTNTISSRATNAAIDWKRRGVSDGEVIQGVESDLDDQSDKWIDGVASKGANEAFAEGRESGFEEFRDEIARYIYSALLDINTCEACAAADGQEGESEDDIPDTPNPDCDGGDRCRCVKVAVFKDEQESAA